MQKKGAVISEKSEIIEDLAERAKKNKILEIVILTLILIFVVLFVYAGLKYFFKPRLNIEIVAEIESVLISENGENAYMKLKKE